MTDPKAKQKPSVPTRTPGKKTKNTGIFDNLRQLPHPVEEFLNPTQPSPAQPTPSKPNPAQPVAPSRDYNKRANSLERDALPSGLFPGTSKKLYDALYMRTRGAVVPVRTIQATKRELMAWSGIRSKNTIAVNLQLLTANGLIHKQLEIGDHDGSVYEVFLPEEASHPNPAQPSPTYPDPTQKLGGDPTQKLGWDGMGKVVDSQRPNEFDKTSFKTNTERDDDEAFARLFARLRQAVKEVTGKEPVAAEAERWEQLADLLVTELKIAAGRTNVSSVPAFLTEHLRRRLWKKDRRQVEEEGKSTVQGSQKKVDASKCPDCFGTGMWYPEGFERGVARCGHEKLRDSAEGGG